MAEALVARASVTIDAPIAKVWDALVNPETIKQYTPVSGVVSEWREGSPIIWKTEWLGKAFESWGTILRIEPPSQLEYTHSRPLATPSRVSDSPRHYHRVTIKLSDDENAEANIGCPGQQHDRSGTGALRRRLAIGAPQPQGVARGRSGMTTARRAAPQRVAVVNPLV